ncbi:MAG TPA: hypothetical protein VLJ14_06900 [Ktedonobacterales bacterium]|jgi:hypothetical protein|nr:hypothetical protein [Ktedonobacterales bacterium]
MMRIRRRIAIVGFAAIVAVLASCAPGRLGAATPLPTATSGLVTLRTDAASYHVSDKVTVTLSNATGSAIQFHNLQTTCGDLIVRRLQDGKWIYLAPCPSLRHTRYEQLDAGHSRTFTLRPDASGVYRVELEYFTAFDGTPPTVVYSAGFQVT